MPSAIERQQGKYKEYGDQKQEESLLVGNFEKEIPVSKGRHRIKMKVSRKIAEMRENLANKNEQKTETPPPKIKSMKNVWGSDFVLSKLKNNNIGENS